MDVKREEAFAFLYLELEKAERKHPEFPTDPEKALAIITEEFLELARAVNDQESRDRQKEEACHVAVTAMRFIEAMNQNKIKNWEV